MGGGGRTNHVIPHYSRYDHEVIKDYYPIKRINQTLAPHGLKDPWIRNYAWTQLPNKLLPMPWWQQPGITRGVWYGLGAVALYIAYDQTIGKMLKKDTGHDGHH